MTAVGAQGQLGTMAVAPVVAVLFGSAFFWPPQLGPLATEMAIHIGLMSFLAPIVAALCVYALRRTHARGAGWLWIATVSQIALLWALHIPNVHHAVMMSAPLRALALGSLFLVAVGFWFRLLDRRASPPWQEVLALLITAKLACLLAVLLVFAPREIYPGMEPVDGLRDQQMAGLLMLIACPLSYLVPGILLATQLIPSAASGHMPGRPAKEPMSSA